MAHPVVAEDVAANLLRLKAELLLHSL